jgi:hypothetical protein
LFTVVIWQSVKEKMGFNLSDEKHIAGMAVVTGKIELYKDKPQMVITNPTQFISYMMKKQSNQNCRR